MSKHKIALGCGYFAIFFISHGIGALAIPYYQMTLGVDPFFLGLVLTVPVLLSAIISPWAARKIDMLSVRPHSQTLLMIVSGWLCAAAFCAMWVVPPHWSVNQSIVYLLLCSLIFFFFATFLTLVMRCLAVEETSDSQGLTSIMGFTTIFEKLGSIIYFWLFPLAQSRYFASLTEGIKSIGLWVAVILIGSLSTIAGLLGKPRSASLLHDQPAGPLQPFSPPLYKQARILFLVSVIQFGLIGLCVNLDFYVLVYFVANGDIADGAIWKGYISTAYALFGLVTIPVIVKAGNKFGKRNTLLFIYLINCINALSKWVLYQPEHEWWLIADAALGAWIWTAHTTLIPAMLADICYENQRQTGALNDSFIVARHHRYLNVGLVISFVTSGLLLNLIGFDAERPEPQAEPVLQLMRLVLVGGSLVFSLLAMICLKRFSFIRSSNSQEESALRLD